MITLVIFFHHCSRKKFSEMLFSYFVYFLHIPLKFVLWITLRGEMRYQCYKGMGVTKNLLAIGGKVNIMSTRLQAVFQLLFLFLFFTSISLFFPLLYVLFFLTLEFVLSHKSTAASFQFTKLSNMAMSQFLLICITPRKIHFSMQRTMSNNIKM